MMMIMQGTAVVTMMMMLKVLHKTPKPLRASLAWHVLLSDLREARPTWLVVTRLLQQLVRVRAGQIGQEVVPQRYTAHRGRPPKAVATR